MTRKRRSYSTRLSMENYHIKKQHVQKRTRWLGGILCFGMLIAGCAAFAGQSPVEIQRYIENKKGMSRDILWCLSHREGYRLQYHGPDGTHTTRTDAALNTISWQMEDVGSKMQFRAERKRNVVTIRGTRNGEKIETQVFMDEAPWFQATSLSLRDFALSEKQQSIQFWVLHAKTLKAFKMKATKKGYENLIVNDKPVTAVKVELRLTGWRAAFWKGYNWYRTKDGFFMRYEGASDATGLYKVTITYAGPGKYDDLRTTGASRMRN